ncbi:MAG: hypothetical protein M1830_000910 [Pleopsidium flavum]|nr:MAG: hypothetical protein M1830_000910 [Pleopsidium flavum]
MTVRDGSALPSHLQLPSQHIPRLPFSSPVGEEITSPVSPEYTRGKSINSRNTNPFASPPLSVQNSSPDFESDHASNPHDSAAENDRPAMRSVSTSKNAHLPSSSARGARIGGSTKHARRFSVNKPSRDKSKRRPPKETSRSRPPGLNLITNFSKPPTLAMRIADAISNRSQQVGQLMEDKGTRNVAGEAQGRPALQTQNSGFVSLADLKALNSHLPSSNTASRPAKSAVSARGHGKELEADLAASSFGHGLSTLRTPSHEHERLSDDGDVEPVTKHDDVAGLGFRLSDYAQSEPVGDSTHMKREDRDSVAWAGFTEISPSDRPIVIGISVPSTRLAEYALSPQSATSDSRGPNNTTPVTPTIVVTPAKKEAHWSLSPKESNARRTRRPISSLYSQPTPYMTIRGGEKEVPPMPTLAAGASCFQKDFELSHTRSYDLRESEASPSREYWAGKQYKRRFSENTILTGDNAQQLVTRGRSFSGESRLSILNRASIDSVDTRHRSRGWWTFITSPFLTRSNTMKTFRSRGESEKRPELPDLAEAVALAQEQMGGDVVGKECPPTDTYPPRSKSEHTSIWTDMTEWEAQRGRNGVAIDHTPRASTPERPDLQKPQDSSATIPFMMVGESPRGAAAEFYEACMHDQNSTTPFYECQNHTCPPETCQALNQEGDSLRRTRGIPAYVAEPRGRNDHFFQEPCDRFAAEFGQAAPLRPSSESDSTDIDEDADISPNIHEAVIAPVVHARSPVAAPQPSTFRREFSNNREADVAPAVRDGTPMTSSLPATVERAVPSASPPGPPPYSPPRRTTKFPKYVAVMPPGHGLSVRQHPQSPGPASPGMQQAISSRGDILMSGVPLSSTPAAEGHAHIVNNYYASTSATTRAGPVTLADLEPPSRMRWKNEDRRQKLEREDTLARRAREPWRGRGCLSNRGCCDPRRPEGRARRKWYIGLTASLIMMIVLIVVLAMTLTRKDDNTPVQSQWLNITGYPPIPTGISTIAQPDAVNENSGCVQPATLWSCALPKELQLSVVPNDPDQPNFRVEIRFRNGSTPANSTSTSSRTKHKRSGTIMTNPVLAGSFIRDQALRIRDAFTDALYSPSPAPPTLEDQRFLSNATDNNIVPFEGESTPFFISFLSPNRVPLSRLSKREDHNGTNTTNPFPDLGNAIPPPDVNQNGTASAANLLPFPSSQPLRFYNRGLPTEHYGFYNYFDRSIFLKSTALLNSSDTNGGNIPDDENGGSTENGARVRCTWAQTRFLVQIWTNQGNSASLLSSSNATTTSTSSTPSSQSKATPNSTTTSANDFNRPGSFPYPVTITLDRHGGDITKKMIYCYGVDDGEKIIVSAKKLQFEDRGFGVQRKVAPEESMEGLGVVLVSGGTSKQGAELILDGGFLSSSTHPLLPLTATNHRGVLRNALKKHKRLPLPSQASNLSAILSALNDYLPYLLALDAGLSGSCVSGEEIDIALEQEVELEWRTTLSATLPGRESPRVKGRGLDYEISFVLSTLASTYTLLSRAQLHVLYAPTTPTPEQRTAAITTATKYLLQATSIHTHLLTNTNQDSPSAADPIDISMPVQSGLASLALAEATLLAVLKDDPYPAAVTQERNKNDREWMIKAPEIPKVRAHLFARLCLAAAEHAGKALAMLGASKNSKKVDERLLRYVEDLRRTASGKACRFFGVDAELGGRTGEGIAWLRGGKKELGFLEGREKDGEKGLKGLARFKKEWTEKREDRKVERGGEWGGDAGKMEEGRVIEMLERKWVKINDTVSLSHFTAREPELRVDNAMEINTQLIPRSDSLLGSMPSGREIHTPKPFIPPSLDEDILARMRAPPESSDAVAGADEDNSSDEGNGDGKEVPGALPAVRTAYGSDSTYY